MAGKERFALAKEKSIGMSLDQESDNGDVTVGMIRMWAGQRKYSREERHRNDMFVGKWWRYEGQEEQRDTQES